MRREGRAEGARPAGNGPDRAAAGGTSDRAAQAPAWRGAVSQSVSQSVSVPCPARLADLQPDTPPSSRQHKGHPSRSEPPAPESSRH